ncbi:MAG: M55 family metallopeptidase [Chloroflexota bacterium]
MKVYISADIEGVTGVTHWDETEQSKSVYEAAREQMTAEVIAACEGALRAGADEILVRDAHDSARNLPANRLPRQARLVRGWGGHPFFMMQELDGSFACAALIGYHAFAGSGGNPLSHSMSLNVYRMELNGLPASEFLFSAYTAGYVKTPLVFLSGDQGICSHAAALHPNLVSVAVKHGVGDSTVSLHPDVAVELIREGMEAAVRSAGRCHVTLPEHFMLDVHYRSHIKAYQCGFFPGAVQLDDTTVRFEHRDFFEVLRFMAFCS